MGYCTYKPLWYNLSWLKDECAHMEESWDIPNMNCESGKLKWLAKGKPEDTPNKIIPTAMRMWLSNSGALPLSLPLFLSTHTVS